MRTLPSPAPRARPLLWARALAVALTLALAAATLPTHDARAALPDAEARMLGLINGARASGGLAEVASHDGLRRVARDWAARLAADHDASGDRQGTLRHNPSLASQLPGDHLRAGENVGYTVLTDASHSRLVDRLHESYMGSPTHRANIMGEYDRVGVGLVTSDDGTMWSAVVFMLQDTGATGGGNGEGAKGDGDEDDGDEDDGDDGGERRSDGEGSASGESGGERGGRSGADSAAGDARGAADKSAAEPAAPPDPPTAAELFGEAWPEGYLAGDRGAALRLLGSARDHRGLAVLLPRSPSTAAPRLLGHQVSGR